jgi:phosphoglycerate dehydrogenase-like enzyme
VRPTVGLACTQHIRDRYLATADIDRLIELADFTYYPFNAPSDWLTVPESSTEVETGLAEFAAGLDVLLVCHGAPRVTERVLAAAPRLAVIGELEGDRFGARIDIAAARRRNITVLDTTHGSSMGVAEWALALALIGLRDAGSLFRGLIGHEVLFADSAQRQQHLHRNRELSGRPVGLIGFGHAGQRLAELLRPFDVDALVHDPYVPRELARPYGIAFADLATVLAHGDVVFCLVPLTETTRGLLGADELALLRTNSVFVNVSRGAVVDSAALLARVQANDIVACLDVFDPEPIPADSPIRDAPNVFLSPHIAGVSAESRTQFFRFMVDELVRYFAGRETTADLTDAVLAQRHGRATDDH